MGENSKIEWCDHTFNPAIGCMKVSDGCKFCYAEAEQDKRFGRAEWGPKTRRVRTSPDNWRKPDTWNRKAKADGVIRSVFCASLSDVGEDHPDWVEPRRDLVAMIERTPNLRWLLLTKRSDHAVLEGSLFTKVGKHNSGRLLDGQEWNQFPQQARS